MIKKAFQIIAITSFMNAVPVSADSFTGAGKSLELSAAGLADAVSLFAANPFYIKRGEPYVEANDPAFMSSGPTEGPKHGYFAVPMLVLGIAGILLYMSKND